MHFRAFKGIIALDIDGTVTAESHAIPSAVISFLTELDREGWQILFITGRPFQWGFQSLQSLSFSYALAVQNGALLLEMPSKKIITRKYLTKGLLPAIENICQEQQTDFVVYSGLENKDYCYYRPAFWSSALLAYVHKRATYLGERWQALNSFEELPLETFPSVKCFAKEKQAFTLSQKIEQQLSLHAPPNKDPFDPSYFVVQATHFEANKGAVLKEFVELSAIEGPIIAAGDDYNDLTLLQQADIKIVMANAPPSLLKIATIIAPKATENGIIQGLKEALLQASKIGNERSVK